MNETEYKVSILCMAYNHEPYIRQTLESFVSQKTDFPFEVLVNDDASTDGTAAIIREYAEKYPDIIVPFYQKENLYSRHISIYETVLFPAARGKYFACCEGDDYWCDPNKLQLQADYLDAHPDCAACVHNTMLRYCDGSHPDAPLIPVSGIGDRELSFENVIKGTHSSFHTSSLLARRELELMLPDYFYVANSYGFSDYPKAIHLFLSGGIHFVDRIMSVYRISSNPASWSANMSRMYSRRRRFLRGEIAMFEALRHHVEGERLAMVDDEILIRQYDLADLEGRVNELHKPPFDKIYRGQSFKYKLKCFVKRAFPPLNRMYRRKMGYED